MRKTTTFIARTVASMLLCLATAVPTWAANTVTTVEQVTETVTLTDDVDYVITSSTPFSSGGVVDITNTEHAVLILDAVRPSAAIPLLASHVTINGQKAVNNQNCQVKLHNLGCIILPYDSSIKPLTVYSEPDFGGTEVNDFGEENTGGYMNTLTDNKLNNAIRSFKLKRGYMVTFSTRAGGRGYSRCFIAAYSDLEVASLPAILDQTISSYRVFKWYDCGKKNVGNFINREGLTALNVQSSYDWGQGNNSMLPDFEWVPNHIYEDYPSSATIGRTTQSPHTKNNNEPRNSADDHPQDLTTILNNWENMMRTGMRLCSPASWDGSDYWNATGFLAEFLDSIDARGWRCDIIDLHCYWPESNFGNIKNWVDKYKRPVWISEWCWGASWNNNGAFASGVTENQVRDALQRICNNLNSWNYVERYYYWNSERDPSRLYKNGSLTPAGKMYAAMNSGLAYNGKYDFVPKTPAQKTPDKFTLDYDKLTESVTLTWHEYNGEYNTSQTIQRKRGSGPFEDVATVVLKETAANYTETVSDVQAGDQFRICVVDANGVTRTTRTIVAMSSDLDAGDVVEVDGTKKYLGGNLLVNGDFDLGFQGWTALSGDLISKPLFQVVPVGGPDGGSYLQAYASGSTNQPEHFIKVAFAAEPNTDYYVSGAFASGVTPGGVYVSGDDLAIVSTNRKFNNTNTSKEWATNFKVFNTGEFNHIIIYLQTLQCKAQFDKLMLCRLFDSRDDAIADGVTRAKERAEAFKAYNQEMPVLNSELSQKIDAASGTDVQSLSAVRQAIAAALTAHKAKPAIDSLITVAKAYVAADFPGKEALESAIELSTTAASAAEVVAVRDNLQDAVDAAITFTPNTNLVTESSFRTTNTWTTKCGTYTQGDQRVNTVDGVTFWNAWWGNVNASEGEAMTMEVKKNVSNLPMGFYTLSCKAMTEHYCISDQHAYITSGDETAVSPTLSADYFDLSTKLNMPVANVWQKLTTTPVYVEKGGTVTIGFKGSKQGATDNAWREIANVSNKGDKREGWWGATEFVLNRSLGYRAEVTPGQFYAVSLPFTSQPGEGIHFYTISAITADHQNLCLTEVSTVDPGKPFIYSCDKPSATFVGYGRELVVPKTDELLIGFFNEGSHSAGFYTLVNGTWERLNNVTTLPAYSACIKQNVISSLVEVSEWTDGPLMPIVGADIDFANAIHMPSQTAAAVDGLYTLDGRRIAPGQQLRGGLYVKVTNGAARKVVIN